MYIILSNGHGEDRIGLELAKGIHASQPAHPIYAMALIGEGKYYRDVEWLTHLGHPRSFPSGGFLRDLPSWLIDLSAGLISHHFRQLRTLKHFATKNKPVKIICVGDLFCLIMARLGLGNNLIFIPTAKSDRFQPHLWIERKIISFCTRIVYPRDQETADSLRRYGIKASYAGNLMMDCIDGQDHEEVKKHSPYLAIIPGSRNEAFDNFSRIIAVCSELIKLRNINFVVACVSAEQQAKLQQLLSKNKTFGQNANKADIITFYAGAFGAIVHGAEGVIALAGTANEQAVGLGKIVFTFPGTGSQCTLKRLLEQQKLLLGATRVYPYEPVSIAKAIHQEMNKPGSQLRSTNLGRKAMGKSGAANTIVDFVIKH